jgi:hypothetical protein
MSFAFIFPLGVILFRQNIAITSPNYDLKQIAFS